MTKIKILLVVRHFIILILKILVCAQSLYSFLEFFFFYSLNETVVPIIRMYSFKVFLSLHNGITDRAMFKSIGFDSFDAELKSSSIETKFLLTLSVNGMTCATCSGAIEKGLSKLDGIISAKVSLLSNTATVEFIEEIVTEEDIIDEIEDIGFDAQTQSLKQITKKQKKEEKIEKPEKILKQRKTKASITIDGMTCATCSGVVEKGLKQVDGIESISVSLITNTGVVVFDSLVVTIDDILDEIEDIGFTPTLKNTINLYTKNELDNNGNNNNNNNNTVNINLTSNTRDNRNAKINTGLEFNDEELKHCVIQWHAIIELVGNNNDDGGDSDIDSDIDMFGIVSKEKWSEIMDELPNEAILSFNYDYIKKNDLRKINFSVEFNKYFISPNGITEHFESNIPNTLEISNVKLSTLLDDEEKESQQQNMKREMKYKIDDFIHHMGDDDDLEPVFETITFTINRDRGNPKQNDQPLLLATNKEEIKKSIFTRFDNLVTKVDYTCDDRIDIEYINWNNILSFKNEKHLIEQYPNVKELYFYLTNELSLNCEVLDSVKNEHNQFIENQKRGVIKLKNKVQLSCIFAIPALIISMILPHTSSIMNHWLNNRIIFDQFPKITWMYILLFLLCTPVQFYIGYDFYVSAYKAAKRKSSNMSTLIVIGTTTGWLYSFLGIVFALTTPNDDDNNGAFNDGAHFFETSSTVITVVLIGKYLQFYAKYKATDGINLLMDLEALTAILLERDAYGRVINEYEISTQLISKYDILKVYRGSKIGLDGTIIYGNSYVNESMLTGESIPKFVTIGDNVMAGSINCGDSVLYIRVDKLKTDCVISQIIDLMKYSQMNKPSQQEFADKISNYFVPIVILIAFITFIVWYSLCLTGIIPEKWLNGNNGAFFSLIFSLNVIVIACPCALGLAVPTAVMVGTGIASKYGLLIKGGNVLEIAHKINTIVFDKTGTLTVGFPKVIRFTVLNRKKLDKHCNINNNNNNNFNNNNNSDKFTKIELIRLAGSAELNSEHPLAKAISSYAIDLIKEKKESGLELEEAKSFEALPGKGIHAIVGNYDIKIGNYKWMFENININTNSNSNDLKEQIELPPSMTKLDVKTILSNAAARGHVTLLMSVDNILVSIITLYDAPKKEAKHLMEYLNNKTQIKTNMLTGDSNVTALSVAKYLGIDENNVISQVLPQDKHECIKKLQNGYKNYVAMVGDGVNDAPALTQADLGVAVGNGTDIAIEAADVILMNDNLEHMITLFDLSKTIIHRIYWNFFWALGFNCLAIPIAAGVLYPVCGIRLSPKYAAMAMACSSLAVLASSLQLKQYKSPIFGLNGDINVNDSNNSKREKIRKNRNRNRNIIGGSGGCGCGLYCKCEFRALLMDIKDKTKNMENKEIYEYILNNPKIDIFEQYEDPKKLMIESRQMCENKEREREKEKEKEQETDKGNVIDKLIEKYKKQHPCFCCHAIVINNENENEFESESFSNKLNDAACDCCG